MSSSQGSSLFASMYFAKRFIILINISKMLVVISLLLKFIIYLNICKVNLYFVNILFLTSGFSLVFSYILSIVKPLTENPNWSIVFPELNRGKKVKN